MPDSTAVITPANVAVSLGPSLVGGLVAYLIAGRAVKDALRKVQTERAFDRKREWYEATMKAVSEFEYDVALLLQSERGGAAHGAEASVEPYNTVARSAVSITRLTMGARLYADAEIVDAFAALHSDTAQVVSGLLYLETKKRVNALSHLHQRLLHTADVLTAGYRKALGYPALQMLLSDDERKALTEWKMPALNTMF